MLQTGLLQAGAAGDEELLVRIIGIFETVGVQNAFVKNTEGASEDGQTNSGVIGWLSNGFVSALPQPPGSPVLKGSNSDFRSGEDGDRTGVIGWVTQGLTKVLPQPDEKYKEATETKNTNEEHTEVCEMIMFRVIKDFTVGDYSGHCLTNQASNLVFDVATMPDYDPLPHVPVVEVLSEEEGSEVESLTPQFPPKVVNWIKQIIPQPVILPSGGVPTEPPPKASRSSLDKILSPPPESLSGISLDTESTTSGVVDWFMSGLGLKMPQLVLPSKDEAEGGRRCEPLKQQEETAEGRSDSHKHIERKPIKGRTETALQSSYDPDSNNFNMERPAGKKQMIISFQFLVFYISSKLKPDMVLEDLESDNDGQQMCESHPKAAESLSPMRVPAQQQQQEETRTPSSSVQRRWNCGTNLEAPALDSMTKTSQEDAETQTGRWTPFIESIKKEAEDVALATMEERLLQERMEMARLAEEVARQTAEMAVRQMASEGTSIKLSLESQELLEEPEPELLLPQEEDSKVEQGEDTE
ncbi:hypothetical protein CRENBAI_013523 [Crenichthys baileyi]|uniref:Uncharacterized protein n=1 Tax=Crenichthys baileyi TaxID=28760 RepID=A0AAV9RLK6_9TELE